MNRRNLRTLGPLLAILALLLMQQLGVLHRYAHGQGAAQWVGLGSIQAGTTATPTAATKAGVPTSSLAVLSLGASDGGNLPAHESTQCGLLDHLCTGDAVAPALLTLPVCLLAAAVFVFFSRRVWGLQFFAFQARAPPALSFNR